MTPTSLLMFFAADSRSLITPTSDDICYATQNRQTAVKLLAEDADLVLVLGSDNSSNSRRLREVAEGAGAKAFLIDDATEIDRMARGCRMRGHHGGRVRAGIPGSTGGGLFPRRWGSSMWKKSWPSMRR